MLLLRELAFAVLLDWKVGNENASLLRGLATQMIRDIAESEIDGVCLLAPRELRELRFIRRKDDGSDGRRLFWEFALDNHETKNRTQQPRTYLYVGPPT